MTPTPRLRFVERTTPMHPFYKAVDEMGQLVPAVTTTHVLKQWWIDEENNMCWDDGPPGEWRDVPLEKEAV